MKIATVTIAVDAFMRGAMIHTVGFDDRDRAKAEYDRIADLMDRREKRENKLPHTVELVGLESVTVPLDRICGVSFSDFAALDANEAGVVDAFPNLFKR